MQNKKILKEKRSKEDNKKEVEMEEKNISLVGVGIAIMASWDKIVTFIQSFFEGISSMLDSFPPIMSLGLIIWIMLWLGKKK